MAAVVLGPSAGRGGEVLVFLVGLGGLLNLGSLLGLSSLLDSILGLGSLLGSLLGMEEGFYTARIHKKKSDGMTHSNGHDVIVETALNGNAITLVKHDGPAASESRHLSPHENNDTE